MDFFRAFFYFLMSLTLPQMAMTTNHFDLLTKSLSENFHLQNKDLIVVSEKISPYFENIPNVLLNDFLILIQEVDLIPLNQQVLHDIKITDAVINAPKSHQIVFENDYVRILEVVVIPGETVPFHSHQWDSITLTIQGSKFRIDDGNILSEEAWLPMAEKLEGSLHTYSYKNIGSTEFHAFALEIKK